MTDEKAGLTHEMENYLDHVIQGYNKGVVAAAEALEKRAEEREEAAASDLLRAQELRDAAKLLWSMVRRDG